MTFLKIPKFVAGSTIVFLASLFCGHELSAESPLLGITEIFEMGHGYESARAPALAMMADGALLCFVSRKRIHSDWAPAEVVLRRSGDGGANWGPIAKIIDDPTKQISAHPVVDRHSNTLHLIVMRDYRDLLHMSSQDGGVTFSKPRDIASVLEEFRKTTGYQWTIMATGPGSGIQLKSGRLILPLWFSDSPERKHQPSVVATLYSDDAGATWHCGDIVAAHSEETPNPSEAAIAELADGRVMLNIRSESKRYRRLVATSQNGADQWTRPEFVEDLFEPICHASMASVSAPASGGSMLVFVNPDTSKHDITGWNRRFRPRENLTIRASFDDGKTWPVSQRIDSGRSAYSDTIVGVDGRIYIVYERGFVPEHELHTRSIAFVSLAPGQLACSR